MSDSVTPFRQRYESSLCLSLQAQLEECADYLQHPEILISEFLEACYAVERALDPDRDDKLETDPGELILEPFSDSRELRILRSRGRVEMLQCVAGAFDPLPAALHPALARRGLDYVALRSESSRLVLGMVMTADEQSAYPVLLRGLNCLAELTPPFQVARLRRHVVPEGIEPSTTFDLQIGLTRRAGSDLERSVLLLTRDLAEVFKERIGEQEQFRERLGLVECLQFDGDVSDPDTPVRACWRA